MENEDEPKISQVEAFMVLAPLAILDVVDVALLFAGLDDFFIIDAAAFPLTQFYFRMKGVRANYMLTSNLLELVPYAGKLPMRTIGAIITIRAANNPEGIVAEAVSIGGAVVRKKLQAAREAGKSEVGQAGERLKEARRAEQGVPTADAAAATRVAEQQAAEARRKAEEAQEKFKGFETIRRKAALERGVPPEADVEVGSKKYEVREKEGEEGNSVIRPPFGEERGDSKEAA